MPGNLHAFYPLKIWSNEPNFHFFLPDYYFPELSFSQRINLAVIFGGRQVDENEKLNFRLNRFSKNTDGN